MSNRTRLTALAAVVALTAVLAARVSSEPFSRRYPRPPSSLRQPPPPPLDRVIPEVRLDSMPLEDLLKEIGRLAGVEIKPDWNGLKEDSSSARVYPLTHVHVELRLRNVTLEQVLAKVSESMDHGELLVARPAETGTVRILHAFSPSAEPPAEAPVARYYDVRSLLREVDFTPYQGQVNACFGTAPPVSPRRSQEDELASLVMDSVAPDSWAVNGGTLGECDVFAGRLVVIQTPENHRQVERLLEQIRDPWPEDPK